MIDCHTHTITDDDSTPENRAERADQLRRQGEALGVEKFVMIGRTGNTVEECCRYNGEVAAYQREHSDLIYGWARAHPAWEDEAVAEFRRAVQEDGLVGLKHHFGSTQIQITDERFYALAEAAVEMDVPVISHVMNRHPDEVRETEASSWHVAELAESFPTLKFISGHIAAGGYWEHRIKEIQDYDNVYLDLSGSNCEAGVVEMAAEYLGTERLIYGSDGWFIPCVGKLEAADLTPEEKVEIGYKFEELLADNVPTKYSEAELAEKRAATLARFEAIEDGYDETIVDANSFIGAWPYRPFAKTADELAERMERRGVDRALVSSMEAIFYQDPHQGNHELAAAVEGREDRFIPVATVDPTMPAWKRDLEECLGDLGMEAVKLLPLYHDYAPNDDAAKACLDYCAERDVPVIICGPLEDQRGRHTTHDIRGEDDIRRDFFSSEQVDQLIELLRDCPETDVVIADAWNHADRIKEETTEVRPEGVRYRNRVRTGKTLFTLGDFYMWWPYQGEEVIDHFGTEHLVTGTQLPFKAFDSHYFAKYLPVDEAEKDRVRGGNVLALLE